MTYRWYKRNNSLYIQINLPDSQKMRKSVAKLGEIVWDKDKARAKGQGAYEVNTKVREIESLIEKGDIEDIKSYFEAKPTSVRSLLSYMESYLGHMKANTLKGQRKNHSTSSLRTYGALIKNYKLFGKDIDINECNLYGAKNPQATALHTNNHFYNFCRYLTDKKLSVSTQKAYLAFLASTLNYMEKKEGIKISSDLRTPELMTADVITLPFGFVNRYKEARFDDPLLNAVHIYTCVQLESCLRMGDVLLLDTGNFKGDVVWTMNQKTKVKTEAPLTEATLLRVMSLFEKYGSIQHPQIEVKVGKIKSVNEQIKNILLTFDEMHDQVSFRTQDANGEITIDQGTYVQLLTSHNFRKTAISLYSHMGMSDDQIKQMSGHTTGSSCFNKNYKRINAETTIEKARKIQTNERT